MCPIPTCIDMTAVLGLHKFSLQATIMDDLCILVTILPLSTVLKTFYCNDSNITELEIIDTKNSTTSYSVIYKLVMWWFLDNISFCLCF